MLQAISTESLSCKGKYDFKDMPGIAFSRSRKPFFAPRTFIPPNSANA